MNKALEKLIGYRKKTITLCELKALLEADDDIRRDIEFLVRTGLISPILSAGTDGNLKRPLYARYRVNPNAFRPKGIEGLHHTILASSRIGENRFWVEYMKLESQIEDLNAYVISNGGLPIKGERLTRNQRAFAIWGDEKALEIGSLGPFLSKIGITYEMLGIFSQPDTSFHSFTIRRRPTMRIILFENYDPYLSYLNLITEMGQEARLLGRSFDGAVFASGNKAANGENLMLGLHQTWGRATDFELEYWGDIDRAGIGIFNRLCASLPEARLVPFGEGYRKMLALSADRVPGFRVSPDTKSQMPDTSGFVGVLDDLQALQMQSILEKGHLIPQEIVNMADFIKEA